MEEYPMKSPVSCLISVVAALLFSLLSSAQAPAKSAQSDSEQILQLERDWVQSFVTMDVAANQRIMADDFVGTEPDGTRSKKADTIAFLKTGEAFASNHLNEDDVTIRFYGEVAVVNGSESWKQKNGKAGRYIWTDVFVKRSGQWQVVSAQDLEAPPK
jgi:ketosteroid isomerase-like protein